MINENNFNLNMGNNEKKVDQGIEDVELPISAEEYKKTLASLSREDIIAGLIANGASAEEANDLADDFDKDR